MNSVLKEIVETLLDKGVDVELGRLRCGTLCYKPDTGTKSGIHLYEVDDELHAAGRYGESARISNFDSFLMEFAFRVQDCGYGNETLAEMAAERGYLKKKVSVTYE
jgi:hypothetical protein